MCGHRLRSVQDPEALFCHSRCAGGEGYTLRLKEVKFGKVSLLPTLGLSRVSLSKVRACKLGNAVTPGMETSAVTRNLSESFLAQKCSAYYPSCLGQLGLGTVSK